MLEQNPQGDCSAPKKMSQTESQFYFVDKQTAVLDGLIIQLSDRLAPLLRVNPPQTIGEQKDSESLTPLANQVRKIGKDITNFAEQIESILERLEL